MDKNKHVYICTRGIIDERLKQVFYFMCVAPAAKSLVSITIIFIFFHFSSNSNNYIDFYH